MPRISFVGSAGSCAIRICEPRQVRKEAAISGISYVPQVSLAASGGANPGQLFSEENIMQHRMKEFTMAQEDSEKLLERAKDGVLSTNGEDGYPYGVPVNFVYKDGCIYIHGLNAGEKLANIKADPRVCFTVYDFKSLLTEGYDIVCLIDAAYESVVVKGTGAMVEDMEEKSAVLKQFVAKYAPHQKDMAMPEERIKGVGLLKITPDVITGKYHN